ncbi:MAG: hypothetical protein LBH93_00390 [Chitinispirillales bacterium]|nr:hypothetical protein [Chitinispirillales bacterium]
MPGEKKPKMFDLTTRKVADFADKGAEMQIADPSNGELVDAFIRVLGTDSAEYQKRVRAWLEKSRAKPVKQITLADSEKSAMENRIACVIGWRGIALDGKELEHSPENVRLVLTDPNYRWLCEQIDAFMAERENFIKSSGKS